MSEKTKETAAPAATKSRGVDLVGPLGRNDPSLGREYKYWVGVFPACPVEALYCAGICFPKVTEKVLRGQRHRTGATERVPQVGGIVPLTADKIRLLRERLPRLVVRFNAPRVRDEPMSGALLEDATDQERTKHKRPGRPIRIPTDEEMQQARANRLSVRPYVRGANDEPAARFMFAQLCEDQDNPKPGTIYPESLEATGLSWPDPLE